MDEKNVSYGKPRVGGAVYVAPIGTTLPEDAKTALAVTFKSLGYISEDGLTNENSPESEKIKAWGGDTVLVTQTGKEDNFMFKLIESVNVDVLKQVYGADNVTGDLSTAGGITIKANSKPLDSNIYIVDMILKGGLLKRIVLPNAIISEIGEIAYMDDDAIGFEITLSALPDLLANTHYEYITDPKVV